MKEIRNYVILVSIVGVLQLVNAICVNKWLAVYIWIGFNSIALLLFVHRFLFYRAIISKYLSLNLRYLGDNYKQPFLVRSFIGKLLLLGKADAYFNDVNALTTYKYFKILQLLGAVFGGFALVALVIVVIR